MHSGFEILLFLPIGLRYTFRLFLTVRSRYLTVLTSPVTRQALHLFVMPDSGHREFPASPTAYVKVIVPMPVASDMLGCGWEASVVPQILLGHPQVHWFLTSDRLGEPTNRRCHQSGKLNETILVGIPRWMQIPTRDHIIPKLVPNGSQTRTRSQTSPRIPNKQSTYPETHYRRKGISSYASSMALRTATQPFFGRFRL